MATEDYKHTVGPTGVGAERELEPHRGAHGSRGAPMHRHIGSITEYGIIFGLLMVLLALTVYASYVDLRAGNIVVMYLIAVIKGVLIVMFFMHVRHASRLTWIFSAAAFVWLSVMFVFTFNDYISRPETGIGNPTPLPVRMDKMYNKDLITLPDPRDEGRPGNQDAIQQR